MKTSFYFVSIYLMTLLFSGLLIRLLNFPLSEIAMGVGAMAALVVSSTVTILNRLDAFEKRAGYLTEVEKHAKSR